MRGRGGGEEEVVVVVIVARVDISPPIPFMSCWSRALSIPDERPGLAGIGGGLSGTKVFSVLNDS